MIRISGPAVSVANLELVALADLKTYLATTGQTADDARLQQIVNGINRSAYERMRRRFVKHCATNWDLIIHGSGDTVLALPYRPINAFTSITRGYYNVGGWVSDYVYPSTEYVRDDEEAILHNIAGAWPGGTYSLRVVAQFGWTTAPEDLKLAILEWMAVEYQRASGERLDMTSRTDDSGANTYTFTTIPSHAAEVLERYTLKGGLLD